MANKFIGAAFDKVCNAAEAASDRFVSLYERTCQYGGPEEGGWWRRDVRLVKTMRFSSQAAADAARTRIDRLANELSQESQRRYAEHCRRECEWCEERMLDADYLGEPDGPEEYFVVVEEVAGGSEYRAPTHYE
jgi:hypothetical protein